MTIRMTQWLVAAMACCLLVCTTLTAQTTQPSTAPTSQPVAAEPKKSGVPTDDEIEAAKRAVLEASAKKNRALTEENAKKGPTQIKSGSLSPTKPNAAVPTPPPPQAQPKSAKKGSERPVKSLIPKTPEGGATTPPQGSAATPSQGGVAATPPGIKPGAPVPTPATKEAAPTATEGGSPIGETQTTIRFEVGAPNPDARTYRFDYQATPWNDVLTDFSRMSGLPFLNQPDPPITENMTFRSPRDMTYKEALHQLNELLLNRPLNKYLIHRQQNYLTIKRLPDLMREIPPERMFRSFEEMDASKPDDFDIVMVNLPTPTGWSCYEIIEEFRTFFSDTYGTQCKGDVIELTGIVLEHHRFEKVVKKLAGESDPQGPDTRPKRTFELKVTKATDIQNMLRQIFPVTAAGAVRPGAGPGVDPKAENAKKIDMIPDVKNNKLIVIASQRALDEISQMIEKLDTGAAAAPVELRIVKLQYTDANQMTMLIKQIFAREQQELIQDPTVHVPPERKAAARRDIFADPSSNSVILLGTKDGLESAEKLVREWDKPDENTVTQIVELKNADAATVAATMATIFPPQAKPGQQPPKIAARTSNTLLVSASKQDFEKLKDTIAKLDVQPDDEAKQHLVKLTNATPSGLSGILLQIAPGIVPPKAQVPGRPPMQGQVGGTSMRFVPDDASGYLIVYASDKEWERVEPLIKQLDEQTGIGESKLTTIALKHASATDMVNTLKMMFPPPPPQQGKPVGMAQAAFLADEYNDAVQIYASTEFTKKVEPIVRQLDIPTKGDLTVIKLTHAKAEAIAPILTQAVAGSSGAPAAPGQPGLPQLQAPRATGSVRIVAEPITNSLLVQAPAKELEQIQKLVADMEEKSQTARVIVEAKNRGATELAEILKTLTSSGGGPVAAIKAPGAPASTGSMMILPSGRTIILDGPQDQVAKCLQLLDQIDVPYDQPIFRKYRVQDAEEDEKKLRAMLAMSPSGKASGAKPAGAPGTPPPAQLAAPEAITIYADTNENTLIVGAKVEGDLKIVESCLTLVFTDPTELPKGPSGAVQPFFTVALKNKDAFDIAYDVEDLVNPESKSGGIKVDEGPNKKTLLVKNCSNPAQKQLVMDVVAMYDVPERGRVTKNKRILDCKIPPSLAAKIISQNYVSTDGRKVKVIGDLSAGLVPTIDIHADEPPEPTTQPSRSMITPCVLPASILISLASIYPAQTAEPLHDPGTCPICRQSACTLPGGMVASLESLITASFDDPIYDTPKDEEKKNDAAQHNHVTTPSKPATEDSPADDASLEPTVIIDPDSGKIIILGSEDDLDDMEDILDDLTEGDSPPVIRQFPLKYEDVNKAAALLEQVFNQGTAQVGKKGRGQQAPIMQPAPVQPGKAPVPGQPQGQPGQPPQPGQPGQPQQQMQQQAGPSRIKAIPNVRTKSLLVVAPPQDIPLVIDVLKTIDQKVAPSNKNIRMFRLQNLEASQVVTSLREVLGLEANARGARGGRQQGQPGQPQPQEGQPQQQVFQMAGQQGQGATALVSADEVKLTAEEQTNTVIAQGPTDTLDLIDKLIGDLEKETNTTQIVMRRVPLEHARATDIATVVKEVAGQVAGGGGGGGEGGRGRGRGGSISVNADPRTNSVILAGQAKEVDRVEKVVKDLDVDQEGAGVKQFAVSG
ncbi:MAG: secretin N-terminal domain-containing protein, partial [Planctomycetota bacterium]